MLCNNKNCSSCFSKSFASNEKAKYWSPKNILSPRDIFKGTGKKYFFICEKGHEFEKVVGAITGKQNSWCPQCVNKTEQKLYESLIKLYPLLKFQINVMWCKNEKNNCLPFDFMLDELKIIIELDGGQHFIQVHNWKLPEETQKNDKFKMKCANENKYSIIRILQEDVLYDKYNWLGELNSNIQKITNENKIQNIFMCKNNEYDIYKTNY